MRGNATGTDAPTRTAVPAASTSNTGGTRLAPSDAEAEDTTIITEPARHAATRLELAALMIAPP
jgi:hypothetical protein